MFRSPASAKAQLPSLLRLWPSEVIATPEQFPPERLFATMVFCRWATPALLMPPPEPSAAELRLTVLLSSVSLPVKLL